MEAEHKFIYFGIQPEMIKILIIGFIIIFNACGSSKDVKIYPSYVSTLENAYTCKSLQINNVQIIPLDSTDTFKPGHRIYIVLHFKYISGSHKIRFIWYDQTGKVMRDSNDMELNNDSKFHYDVFVYDSFDQLTASNNPSSIKWNIVVFYDENYFLRKTITIAKAA